MPIAIFTPYVCVIQTYHLSTTRDSKKYYDFLTSYSIPHEIRQGAKCHDEQVAYKFIFFCKSRIPKNGATRHGKTLRIDFIRQQRKEINYFIRCCRIRNIVSILSYRIKQIKGVKNERIVKNELERGMESSPFSGTSE